MSELSDLCVGRWPGILERFGVDARYLTGKHGPCPVCGGHDRFRFDDKQGRGTFFCSQCGAGDGFTLLMRLKNWGYKEAATEIEAVVGKIERRAPNSHARNEERSREILNGLWKSGVPISPADPVARYLENRRIVLASYPVDLRYVAKCYYRDAGGQTSSSHPAMVAMVRGPDGAPATLHRTYIDNFGAKAAVAEVRKLMPGKLPPGSAIRLADAGPVLGIAEGIETALAASIIWSVPVWAVLNTTMMAQFQPPAETEKLFIFADNDVTFAGHGAAYSIAQKVRRDRPEVDIEVCMPPDAGTDWNDVLRSSRLPMTQQFDAGIQEAAQ